MWPCQKSATTCYISLGLGPESSGTGSLSASHHFNETPEKARAASNLVLNGSIQRPLTSD